MGEADKLIAKAAREILKPIGLFQLGSSRTWIEDNGWFLTVVEYQPSSWSKGAYLNVAVSFLWEQGKTFEEILPYNIGGRELKHEEYEGDDERFYCKVQKMTRHAKKRADEYRRYNDPGIRLFKVKHDIGTSSEMSDAWNKGMLYYLISDEKNGDDQMKILLKYADDRKHESNGRIQTNDWVAEYTDAAERLLQKTSDEKHLYVVRTIAEKRQRLRRKTTYKKLAVDPIYQ